MTDTADSKTDDKAASQKDAKSPSKNDPKPDPTPEPEVVKESTYSVERLLSPDGQPLTGYESHILAGALAGRAADDELTVAEARKAAEKFLNSEPTAPQEG